MKIVLLAPSNVEEYYTASLLLRGFKASPFRRACQVWIFPS